MEEPNNIKNNIKMDNNKNEKAQNNNNTFEFEGEVISIDEEIINLIINNINKMFEEDNCSSFKTEKEVLEYYYFKEQSSIEIIELNYKENKTQLNFINAS